jgi:hypothetical protein
VDWRLQSNFSSAAAAMPPSLARLAQPADGSRGAADPRDAPVYSELIPWCWARSTALTEFGDGAMPWWLRGAGADATCALLSRPYLAVNMAALPGAYETAVRAVRPVSWVGDAARDWFSSHGLEPHAVVAVHLRLTDMAMDNWSTFAAACVRDAGGAPALAQLSQFVAARALERAPVVLASDDLGSPCAAAVRAHFAARTRVVVLQGLRAADAQPPAHAGPVNDCVDALFVQEVLAQSAAFVGVHASSFSGAVHQQRIARLGYPLNSSLLLD